MSSQHSSTSAGASCQKVISSADLPIRGLVAIVPQDNHHRWHTNRTQRKLTPRNCCMTPSRCQERPKRVRGERQRQQDVEFRQRKKQERQQLQETAQKLETQLANLQQITSWTCSPLHKKRKSFSVWQPKAEAIKQQRLEAELLNMTLRRALAKEQQVAKSLQIKMNKRPFMPQAVMYDMRQANLSQKQKQTQTTRQCCNPTTLHINPVAVGREIEATLQQMIAQADSVLNVSADDNSISFDSRIRLDPDLGLTTEVTSSTPMNCTLDRAVKLLGSKFSIQQNVDLIGPRCVPRPHHVGGERQFTVELGAPYQTVLLDGFGSTRKSDDDNRRLIVWAAVSFDRCGALCFRERTWLAGHRSRENPASASVIRSHYSLTAEKAVGCTMIDGGHIEMVRDRALRAMGKQIKERYLAMQRGILLQTGRGDLIGFVGS